jgi:hypothetical protein
MYFSVLISKLSLFLLHGKRPHVKYTQGESPMDRSQRARLAPLPKKLWIMPYP